MKATIIAGIFGVIGTIITGIFLIITSLIDKGFILTGPEVQVGNLKLTPTQFTQNKSTPIPIKSNYTISDAERVQLNEDCSYWEPKLVAFYDDVYLKQNGLMNSDGSVTWDISQLRQGIIVGDANNAEVDGQILGSYIFFTISSQGRKTLRLTQGGFLIVSPDDLEGAIRLRQRMLECKMNQGNYTVNLEVVRFP
jgi:hypothetical protein